MKKNLYTLLIYCLTVLSPLTMQQEDEGVPEFWIPKFIEEAQREIDCSTGSDFMTKKCGAIICLNNLMMTNQLEKGDHNTAFSLSSKLNDANLAVRLELHFRRLNSDNPLYYNPLNLLTSDVFYRLFAHHFNFRDMLSVLCTNKELNYTLTLAVQDVSMSYSDNGLMKFLLRFPFVKKLNILYPENINLKKVNLHRVHKPEPEHKDEQSIICPQSKFFSWFLSSHPDDTPDPFRFVKSCQYDTHHRSES